MLSLTKKIAMVSLVSLCATTSFGAEKSSMKFKNDKQKVSYAIGHQIGSDFKMRGLDTDLEMIMAGLKDGNGGKTSPINQEETMKLMQDLQKTMQAKMEADRTKATKENTEKGKVFLEANKKKEGVVTIASGLQYKILKEGKGAKPTSKDTVSVHYKGTLIDGTEFDSSFKRNEPAKFPVTGVIKGWTEALQLMPVGSKWQLFIPASLAYGEGGAGQLIGPNSTLVFDVELLSIEAPKAVETPKGTTK